MSDKHSDSIIQGSSRRRVRRPGSRRQLRIAAYVLVIVAAAIVVAYFLIRPQNEGFTLRDFRAATVQQLTIHDDLQLGGSVRVRSEATVKAPASGTLESLEVDVGHWVAEGQLVAVLEAVTLEDSLEALQSNLEQSTRQHQALLLNREQAKLSTAQTRRQLAAALESVEDDLTDARELFDAGTMTASALQGAEDAVESARVALDDHDAGASISEQLHQLDRLGSEDNLDSIEDQIANLEGQLAETQVTAPIAGRVIWTVDTITSIGEPIAQETPILQIADTGDPFVATAIAEQYVPDLVLGQQALVTVGGEEFPGFIERIGLLATAPPEGGIPTVDLDISVEAEDIEVLPGSTALAELIVGTIPDAIVLPRGPYLVTGNRTYLYVVDGEAAVRTPVTYGAVTEEYVQIIAGVSVGDEVITSSYQNFIDFEHINLEVGND